MSASRIKICSAFALAVAIVLSVMWEGVAQTAPSGGQDDLESSNPPGLNPESAEVWNSPQMVKARAWLNDYLSKSAKVTPKEAAEYKAELERLSPKQMKLWLLKFDHEEEQRQAQYKAFQQSHNLALAHSMAFQKATRQAMANVSQGETAAAEEGQQEIDTENARAADMQEDKLNELNSLNLTGPGYGYWGGPYGFGGYGGIHYHVHVHQ